MSQSTSRKRPWLAALLAALVTGLGHLYLRRLRRALGWLVVLFGVTALLVDPATLDALASGEAVNPAEIAPVLITGSLSILDAYVLARAHNSATRGATTRASVAPDGTSPEGAAAEGVASDGASADGDRPKCPHCKRELDPELDFCHWCNSELEVGERAGGDAN